MECPENEEDVFIVLSDAVPCVYTKNKMEPKTQKLDQLMQIDNFFIS